jgi:phosphatidate cytidylyltransferase
MKIFLTYHFFQVVSILLSYYLITGIGFYFISKKKDEVARKRLWLKFFVYLALVSVLVACMKYAVDIAFALICVIALIGAYEVITSWKEIVSARVKVVSAVVYAVVLFGVSLSYEIRDSLLPVFFLIVVFDGFSQTVGELVKGKTLAPRMSPNKTRSGFIGGALVMGFTTWWILEGEYLFLIGMAMAVVGLYGDLLASWLKRFSGKKDFSEIIPGHGGVLDRFDSFLAVWSVLSFVAYFFHF